MENLSDLHTHSVLSRHAYSSLTENIESAYQKGLKYYGISEHQNDDKGVGAHPYAFLNLHVVPSEYKGMRILKGVELNILKNGLIDTSKLRMREFDYCIASLHGYMYPSGTRPEEDTEAYLNVLDYDFVTIIGHMDDSRYSLDYDRIIRKAKEKDKMIELNNSSLTPGSSRGDTLPNDIEILRLCKTYSVPVIVNSDAHICYDVGNCSRAFELIDKTGFPHELVANFNEDLLKKMLNLTK